MSDVLLVVPISSVPKYNKDMSKEQYDEYVLSFMLRLKLMYVNRLVKVYKIDYQRAMKIAVSRNISNEYYYIGIDSPVNYPSDLRLLVTKILEIDRGSVTKKIKPLSVLTGLTSYLSLNIQALWRSFSERKIRESG